jgi:hypothetical protein
MALGPPSRDAFLTGLAVAATLCLSACHRAPTAAAPGPAAHDQAVATVDGKTVWAADVRQEAIAQGQIGRREALDTGSDTFRRMLDEVVDQRLLAAEAARRGLDKEAAVQRSLAAAHDRVLGDALVEQVVDQAVSDAAVAKLYAEQQKVAPPGAAPVSLEAARPQIVRFLTYDQIRDLLERLRSRSKVEVLVKTAAAPQPPADAPPPAPAQSVQGVRP